ncbi:chromosome partitioning protein ParB [Achromobacter pulmonis]|uniref:Chromosome partitioning protein ParB n=1 Tax=Achromobacter pulmonis TaxID=1389932 RepID=A0A2N8K9Q9_9BURK|nr:PRTRC system protein C [Achromobacter pulmonis]PND30195.1 chromosome partitioning protein ParB [Achromobacter pulmonis]
MSIEVSPIVRTFTYQGIMLPDVPGLAPGEVRNLYSAQYPELISAEIDGGEVVNGRQDYTFRKAVGVKGATRSGGRLAALRQRVQDEAEGRSGSDPRLDLALTRRASQACAQAWSGFAELDNARHANARAAVTITSDMLAPLP